MCSIVQFCTEQAQFSSPLALLTSPPAECALGVLMCACF